MPYVIETLHSNFFLTRTLHHTKIKYSPRQKKIPYTKYVILFTRKGGTTKRGAQASDPGMHGT